MITKPEQMNQRFHHVNYTPRNSNIDYYFSNNTVKYISNQITTLLDNKVIVPDQIIINVMNNVLNGFRPITGGIYTRYIMPLTNDEYNQNMINEMINQCIYIIVNNVSSTLKIEDNNKQLDIWSTLYGKYNPWGLRAHSKIKINNKASRPLIFNMNY